MVDLSSSQTVHVYQRVNLHVPMVFPSKKLRPEAVVGVRHPQREHAIWVDASVAGDVGEVPHGKDMVRTNIAKWKMDENGSL